MNRKILLFLIFSLLFLSEKNFCFLFADSPPLAPLIPLEPEFPLGLTESNRQLLIDNPEELKKAKEMIQESLNRRSLPWIFLLGLLGLSGMIGIFFIIQKPFTQFLIKRRDLPSRKKAILETLKRMQQKQIDPLRLQADYTELSILLSETFHALFGWKTATWTTNEWIETLKKASSLSFEEQEKAFFFLKELDEVKFAEKNPSETERKRFIDEMEDFIAHLFSTYSLT